MMRVYMCMHVTFVCDWFMSLFQDEGGEGVGSVSGGGRYDGLVGMFSPKGKVNCLIVM